MADFSSWSDLHAAIKNALANRDGAVGSYRTPDGTMVTYRSVEELIKLEQWAAAKAAAESAASGAASRRVCAVGSGGSW